MKLNLYKSFLFAFIVVAISSCQKEYQSIEELDEENIQAYIQKNNLTGMQQLDTTGIYYQITTQGTGAEVKNTDRVYITYSIKTFNDEYVSNDENTNRYTNFLGYFTPEAWQTGVRDLLKKKGGTIRMLIPSRKAYGRNGRGKIPENASLDCTLTLHDVNNITEFEDIFVKKYIQKIERPYLKLIVYDTVSTGIANSELRKMRNQEKSPANKREK